MADVDDVFVENAAPGANADEGDNVGMAVGGEVGDDVGLGAAAGIAGVGGGVAAVGGGLGGGAVGGDVVGVAAGGGDAWGAALVVGVAAADDFAQMLQQRRDLANQRRVLSREIHNRLRRESRLVERARGLSDAQLLQLVAQRAVGKAKAKAKAKAKGKAKAKAKG